MTTGYRRLLAPLSDPDSAGPPLETALLLGRMFDSHVVALHVRVDPASAVPLVGEGMSGAMVEEMIEAAERQAAERAADTRGLFDHLCKQHEVSILDIPQPRPGLSAEWREKTGREEDIVSRCGRLYDLLVMARPQPDRELPSILTLNAALMESGRPMLVAPPQTPKSVGKKVAVAWNGSVESVRAIAAALPILARAEQVAVFTAQEVEDESLSPAEIAAYLAWHGIEAEHHGFSASGRGVGEALHAQVREMGADLLVMGAYTHSRLRQLILGGVTRYMLSHADMPLLLSH